MNWKYLMSELYTTRRYPCGCKAEGPGDVPAYCATHDQATHLQKAVEQLEKRVRELEARGPQIIYWPYYVYPSPPVVPSYHSIYTISAGGTISYGVGNVYGGNDAAPPVGSQFLAS